MKPIFIGYSDERERLTLTPGDLETHVHGVGVTRSGKSKLIEWICHELILNRQGFCLIDPHGSVYDDLVRWLAFVQPRREIVLFNPSHTERIVGFNPFRQVVRDSVDVSVQVDRRIKATIKAWGATDTNQTPRLERWLRCVYQALIDQGHPIDVARYLVSWGDKEIRNHLIRSMPADFVRRELEELAAYTRPQDFSDQIESTRNRLQRFLVPLPMRRIMGSPTNNLDIEDIIETGKILLVNLQPSDVITSENASMLGTLLLNEIWEVASRRKTFTGGRPPTSWPVIIDEFQMFLTPDMPLMLDQAAKRGIHLFLFHQRLSQLQDLDPNAYGALNNARIKIVFGGLSRDDARTMAGEIFPGQIDLKRIKFLIEQTKFWPTYTRETVRSENRGGARGHGNATASLEGLAWNPLSQEWVPSSAASQVQNDFDSAQWADGIADVPFLYPEPFTETSSITSYSLEELLWELADRLMLQYQRHFMIRRPGHKTVAAATPYVKPRYVRAEVLERYVNLLLSPYLTASEVEQALEAIHQEIAAKALPSPAFEAQDVWNVSNSPAGSRKR